MPGGILLAATTKHFLYSAFFRFRLFCQISGRLVCLRKLEFFYTNCVISLDIAVERWYFNNQALTRFKVLVFSTHCVSVF